MATPGQLVQAMAVVLGIPSVTVSQYDRQLAEAGLRTKGGRGNSAAKITTLDAANLLITILGSPVSGASISAASIICKEVGSISIIEKYSKLDEFSAFGLRMLTSLPAKHTLCEAFAALFEDAMEVGPDGDPILNVTVRRPNPAATINCLGIVAGRKKRAALLYNIDGEYSETKRGDLLQQRSVSGVTFERIGKLIAAEAA